MKTAYYILLCCSCLVSCHSQAKNKEIKSDLSLSLLFYSSFSSADPIYSIDMINDSLIIKLNNHMGKKEYRNKLTDNQISEIKRMTSALTQKYDWSSRFVKGGWGCTLKVDNQVYYEDNRFSFIPYSKEMNVESTPKEIKILIDFIVSLSPIPIELYGF